MKRRSTKQAVEERHEKITALRERLAAFEDQLSDEEQAVILAQFAGYSARNALLIASQCPTATEVHGFREWLTLGRQVRKGQSGIAILAPIPPRGEQPEGQGDGGSGEESKPKMRFRLAYLFDITQTDPAEQAG